MIAYTLKQVLALVPEALPFVKKASVEEDFPLNNKDSCMASALAVEYCRYISHQSIDPDTLDKVASAAEVYGLTESVKGLSELLQERSAFEKSASAQPPAPEACMTKLANFEGELTGFKDIDSLVKQAETLLDECREAGVEASETVKRYACDAYLSKEAALDSLNARFYLTKNATFAKIAAALGPEASILPSGPLVKSLCQTVNRLDKEAGLHLKGFDIYREVLMTKSAAISATKVKLGKEMVPLETILRVPRHHITNYLGADVAKELGSDPANAKAIVESLPEDLKHVLLNVVKSA